MHANTAAIAKFFELFEQSRQAALDVNNETGQVACRFSKSEAGAEGLGTPGVPYTANWQRVTATANRKITSREALRSV